MIGEVLSFCKFLYRLLFCRKCRKECCYLFKDFKVLTNMFSEVMQYFPKKN